MGPFLNNNTNKVLSLINVFSDCGRLMRVGSRSVAAVAPEH